MFEMLQEFNGILFDVKLEDRVCAFVQNSGTGKTFLFENIRAYCMEKNIASTFINYEMYDMDAEIITLMCKGKEIIILDNADLYLTQDLLKAIVNDKNIVLLSVKRTSLTDGVKLGFYRVKYSEDRVVVRRR